MVHFFVVATPPRRVIPNSTYYVSRSCSRNTSLLRTQECVDALLYCVAVAAERYNVSIHGVSVGAASYELILTDIDGTLPLFMGWLNRQSARCIKLLTGAAWEVWAPNQRYTATLIQSGPDCHNMLRALETEAINGSRTCFQTQAILRPCALSQRFPPAHRLKVSSLTVTTSTWQPSRPNPPPSSTQEDSVAVIAKRCEKMMRCVLLQFQRHYRDAYRKLKLGFANVVFPTGTWALRRLLASRHATFAHQKHAA